MKQSLIIIILFISHLPLWTQNNEKNTLWMEYIEELSENEMETSQIENLYEELSFLSEHPLNLNIATKQDLERFPFLSKIQIENILYHIYKYGSLSTIYELKNIDGFDYQTIQYLLPFVIIKQENKIESLSLKNMLKYGQNDLLIRIDNCIQQKAGYNKAEKEENEEGSPNRFYLGEPYYLSVRYGFQYKDRIQFSFVGEKDPGEAFWNKQHKGFDFYSANFSLKNTGIIEGLYIGDYRVSFGQGLVLNTDFSMGKTSDVSNISKKNPGIKRHFSTNENDFFRGAAITFKIQQTKLHLFASHRNLDAGVEENTIFSLKTDGYNRTYNDLEKNNQAKMNVGGINLLWKNDSFQVGTTATAYNFGGKELNPELKPYNHYYLRDDHNYNMGIDYSYQRKKLLFQGETAMGKNGALATINNLMVTPASFFALSLSYRNYSYNYQSHFARSLGESSSVQNESGLYFGTKYSFPKWQLAGYVDVFRFPWLKSGIDAPSTGKDILLQVNYTPKTSWNMNLRYKIKEKEKNKTGKTVEVFPYHQQTWKYQFNFKPIAQMNLKTQINYNIYSMENDQTTGWAIAQAFGFKTKNSKFYSDLSFAYFNATEWNNRIYSYEKNILYVFSMPSYSGEGIRYYMTLKWSICNIMDLYTKISSTQYFDKNTISSGLEEISGRKKTEINFLLKLKF